MVRDRDYGLGGCGHAFNFGKIDFGKRSYVIALKQTRSSYYFMNEEHQLEKVSSVKRPWTEAWEQAWEAYQGQQKPGGDEKLASFRNRAKQENDARYLGDKYFKEVCQYLPSSECPPS
jgi:hypothetical protein